MIISNRAFPSIKFRERFGVGNGGVKNNNGLSRQIFRCSAVVAQQENEYRQNYPWDMKAGRSYVAAAVTGGRTFYILPPVTAAATRTNSDFH
jgi:hypothetical protein